MSLEDQDLDNLFRSAGSGVVPPFDDSYWEEMEGMLPDDGKGVDGVFISATAKTIIPPYEEAYWKEMAAMLPGRKKRIAAFWWYSAAGFVLLLSGIGFFYNGYNGRSFSKESFAGMKTGRVEKNQRPGLPDASTFPAEDIFGLSSEQNDKTNADNHLDKHTRTAIEQMNSDFRRRNAAEIVSAFESNSAEPVAQVDELKKNKTGVSYNMARMPFVETVKAEKRRNFYAQAGAGIGQSFVRNSPGSELVHFYTLGAGLQQQIGTMYLSFGINGRLDFINNLQTTSFTTTGSDRSELRQLYAIETPLILAFAKGKNRIGGMITPGFQVGYTGTYISYDAGLNELSRERTTQKMPQSRTLTMEVGAVYMRSFSEKWTGGCVIAADIIRPIGDQIYSGENRLLPVNGSVFFRRNF